MTGIFTIDSTVALAMAIVIMSTVMYMIAEPKPNKDEYLYEISTDLLTVADNRKALHKAVDGDTSGIELIKAATPPQLCLSIDITNQTKHIVFSTNTGCAQSMEYTVTRRNFIQNSKIYTAQMRSWFK